MRQQQGCASGSQPGCVEKGWAVGGTMIAVAGATGDFGGRIARAILERGGSVKAIVRPDCDRGKVEGLRQHGAAICQVGAYSAPELTEACRGASCVVSALSGLRDVIVVDTPDALLVASRDDAQRVGEIVKTLEKLDRHDLL